MIADFRINCFLWLLLGIMLLVWCGAEIFKTQPGDLAGTSSATTTPALIGLSFSILVIVGALATLLRKKWTNSILVTSYVLMLIYGVFYFLFHGVIDSGPVYSAFILFSVITALCGAVFAFANNIQSNYFEQQQTMHERT